VGLIRTALFNWAYARHTGGKLIFRIEDTDAERDSEESYQQIIEALNWLGLDWDEGISVGGPHGPYRQSQRSDLYQDVIAKLVEGGYVYESFSTPEEIEARNTAAGRPKAMGYDGYDRHLTDEQKVAFRAEGREPVLRMRMPDEDVSFFDVVRGEDVTFKVGTVPDYVVVRANGQPLYTLVNPVDDALMEITHVLRGEDLLSSTPRQVVLYRALLELGVAKVMPQFGHLPYVMGEGNKKLSKRDPESNLFHHRDRGFIPEGLLNYLALLGWSIAPDNDIFSMEEMVAAFDVKDVLSNPARFDLKKAESINATHMRLLEAEDFRARLAPYLREAGLVSADSYDSLTEREQSILTEAGPLVQERMTLLGEAKGMLGFLFTADEDITYDEESLKQVDKIAERVDILDRSIELLSGLESLSDPYEVQQALRGVLVDEMGVKPRLAFTPLRVAVTGRRVSPPLFESMEILGLESSLVRLKRFREFLTSAS
jgi:glutamyl-tRNA synthetase